MHHLISSGISPGDIIIAGDSAGAHIALCLVSHLLHPHPDVDPPPDLTLPLAGLLLISPRVTNATTAASFTRNTNRDTLTRETFAEWIANFRANSAISSEEGLAKDGVYTEPLEATNDWWNDLARKVSRKAFVSTGDHECLRDTIVDFAGKWKSLPGFDLTFIVEEKGIHDSPLMDVARSPSELVVAIGHWLAATV